MFHSQFEILWGFASSDEEMKRMEHTLLLWVQYRYSGTVKHEKNDLNI